MPSPLGFTPELFRQPTPVVVWVLFLVAVNLASGLFWDEPLARLVMGTFLISALLMMLLYSLFGFSRILGLGHVLWLLLVPYLLFQLPACSGAFCLYLLLLVVTLSASLVMDIRDVWLYFQQRT